MKKVFLFLLTALLSLSMQAKVGLLIPTDNRSDAETAAATWFGQNYTGEAGGVITLADDMDLSGYTTIWVMVDRVGLAIGEANLPFTATQKSLLEAYVKDGGNLMLTNHATQLVNSIGRCTYAPGIYGSGDGGQNSDVWGIQANIGMTYDHQDHAIYSELVKGETEGHPIFPLIGNGHKMDHNCMWDLNSYGFAEEPNVVKKFEALTHSVVLGTWQHVVDYCCAGIVEFQPTGVYLGTVLANGLAAYDWNAGSKHANIEKLTSNSLTYLEGLEPELDLSTLPSKVWEAFPETLPSQIDGKDVTYSLSLGDDARAALDGNQLSYVADGDITLVVHYLSWTYEKQITMSGYGTATSGVEIAYFLPAKLSTLETINKKAEYNAANWFKTEYIGSGKKGKFITDLSDASLAGIKVLWINLDRVDTEGDVDAKLTRAGWSAENTTALTKFVKAGGSVFVTTHALNLVNKIGRTSVSLNLNNWDNNYSDGGDIWYANIGNVNGNNRSSHAIFSDLTTGGNYGYTAFALVGAVNRSDHNVMWPGSINDNTISLATWGQETNADHTGIVEFEPKGDYTGTIIACGLAAYQWSDGNVNADGTEIANVKKLTSNTLAYLGTKVKTLVENENAETAFLLLANTVDELPSTPEKNAANEFAKTYFAETEQASEGRYISLSELSDIPSTVKTIIIHLDREEPLYTWNDAQKAALTTWVKAGGNLILLRQATMLAYDMNRIDYAPHCQALSNTPTADGSEEPAEEAGKNPHQKINVRFGYGSCGSQPDGMACDFGEPIDRSSDALFDNMRSSITEDGNKKLITLNESGEARNRCYWQKLFGTEDKSDNKEATYSLTEFNKFETRYNCQVLAVEGYVEDFCLASIIRFNRGTVPADSSAKWKGSILAIGAGGFQYTDGNSANFGTMNTLVESAVESIKVSPCENCFRITFH